MDIAASDASDDRAGVVLAGALAIVSAQGGRQASPTGVAATEVRGQFVPGPEVPIYQGGKWIEITYGRPIKRGRDLWGSGANYGTQLNDGSPVWRAGANVSTRLKTEVPLVINGKTVPPGEYSLFIDLKPNNWTCIVSRWAAQTRFDPANKSELWGSFDKVRVHVTCESLALSILAAASAPQPSFPTSRRRMRARRR